MRPVRKIVKELISPKYRYLARFKIRPGDVVIDLGANVGEVAEYFLARKAAVHAYEPNPHVFKILQQRAKGARIYNSAVSNFEGKTKLWLHKDHAQSEVVYSQGASIKKEKSNVGDDFIEIDTVHINTVLDHRRIRLLKIDIEGGEYDIIEGVLEQMNKIDYVVLERHAEKNPAFREQDAELVRRIKDSPYRERIFMDWL